MRMFRSPLAALCVAALVPGFASGPASALETPKDEWRTLKACEKSLCEMILEKQSKGPNLACTLSKTWEKSSLEGGKSKGVSWMFGDARCTANISFQRADIVRAVTEPKVKIKLEEHTVSCVVERSGEVKPVTIKLKPKLVFKDGKADKIWINLTDIKGPDDVTGTVWTAAKLEDSLGIFHKPMIRAVNKFIETRCPKKYGPNAEPDTEEAEAKPATKQAAQK